jgi:O-antigen/teichoic acid export membrane protein
MGTPSLGQATATGAFWNFLELTGRQGIGILVTLLLARFLTPGDFGLVAMLSVFFAIANALAEAGFRQALIRKKDPTPADFSTMFFTNLALGLLSYFLLFVSAPAIASFYGETRLVPLARVAGLVVIINSFQFIQVVDLTRRLDFRTQFKVALPAGILSGLAAVLAAGLGMGAWSLVLQMLLSPLIVTAALWKINRWHPSGKFSMDSFRELFSFGSRLFLSGLLDIVFRNIYVIVIGKVFSAAAAGHYFLATKIRDLLLEQLSGSIQRATYPALSSIQDDDTRLKTAYRKVIRATVYLVFPAMTLLAALARPAFRLLFAPGWLPSAFYLQLLCAAGIMYPLHVVNLNILQVKGRSDLFLYLEILKKTLVAIVILLSIRLGMEGLILGQVAVSFLAYVPNSHFSARLLAYPAREQLGDVFPTFIAALAAMAACSGTGFILSCLGASPLLSLPLQALTGGGTYLLAARILRLEAQETLWNLARERLAKRSCRNDRTA